MKNYEIGILPESTCYSFSPSAEVQKLFYNMVWCGHLYCNREYYIKRESYPPLLLVYVAKGSFHLHIDHKVYDADPGQIILCDCQQPHHYYVKEYCEFYYIHFDGPQAHEICRYVNKTCGVLIRGKNNESVFREMKELIDMCEDGVADNIFSLSSRIYRIFSLLYNPSRSPRLKKNDDSIMRSIAYIRAHASEKITLEQLAEISDLSVYYYSHLFKEMTGISPAEFIINSRIDQAKSLLASSNLSISEISRQVGYPNTSNLITLFTRRLGCPPAQFRKSIGAKMTEHK